MKRLCWILAFLPPLAVESSLRGSVISKSTETFPREEASSSMECPADCSQLDGKRAACHACQRCQWYQRAHECQNFQFKPSDHAHHMKDLATTSQPDATSALPVPDHFCGCTSCTRSVWDRDAHGFSCGFRIRYYTTGHGGNHTMEQACARVATRYDACTPCMPHSCDQEWMSDAAQGVSLADANILGATASLN